MATKISLDSFLAVVKRSNLVSSDQLKPLRESYQKSGGDPDSAKQFAEYLVKQNVLTVWQAEKLLQGKHKGFFLGKYRLLALLGKGGMSSVYLAEHVLMRRRCAIKVLPTRRVHDSSYLGRFHREAQAVAALDHPNIVRAYDVDHEIDGEMEIHFLVMEYVNGKSLLDLVQDNQSLSPIRSAEYIRQAALGLEHAHAAGLVHRDVKPGNLLVDNSGVVKVLDLGLARFFESSEESSLTVQHDERVLGTADYLAPEQAVDSHQVDARADIYSLGCTLYFCLTGHPPFTKGTLAQRLLAHQTKEPTPVEQECPDVPASLGEILRKMMAKEPSDRLQSGREVAEELDRWLLEQPRARGASDRESGKTTERTAASEQETPPMIKRRDAKPKRPKPKAKTAPPARPAAQVEPELGAFLSQLDDESSVASRGATPPPQPKREPVEPKQPKAAGDAAVSVVEAEPVQPSESTVEALPADLATGKDQPDAVVKAETAEPEGAASSSDAASSTSVEPLSPVKKTPKAMWIGGGVAAFVVLAVAIGLAMRGEDPGSGPPDGPPDDQDQTPPVAVEDPGPELSVGADGDFQSISEAIEYIKRDPDRFSGEENWSVIIAGGKTYDDEIVIKGSSFGGLPPGVVISSSGDQPAVLRPDGDGPIIDLNRIEGLTIRGFILDATGRDSAIRLTDFLVGTRLEDIEVRGISQVGIESEHVAALSGNPLRLDRIRLIGTSPHATAIRLADTRHVRLDGCRCVGPFKSGIELASAHWKSDIEIRHCLFNDVKFGIRFSGAHQDVQRVSILNNTFHDIQHGIVFEETPQEGSSGLLIAHNLFTEVTQREASIEEAGDAALAAGWLTATDAARNNWSDRAADEDEESSIDIFGDDGRQGIEPVTYASRDPSADNFLKPTDPRIRNDVKTPTAGADPWVGAVAP